MRIATKRILEGLMKYVVPRIGVYGIDWPSDVKRCWSASDEAIIMDVGANVGDATVRLASVFPHYNIHAFEPVTSTRESLLTSVRSFPNVAVHDKALGSKKGTCTMTAEPNSEINRIVSFSHSKKDNLQQVEVTTVDDFLSKIGHPKVGLMKLDTEGFDVEVLRGSANAIAKGLIDLMVIECTFNPRGAPHVDALELIPIMRRYDYEVVAVYSSNIGRFVRGSGHSDILFARSRNCISPTA